MFRRFLIAMGTMLLIGCAQTQTLRTSPPDEPAASASRSDAMLNKLVGSWQLTGTIAGQGAVHDVDAEWTLQRNYVRINEVSREKGDNGLPAYQATILIGWLDDHYVCFWFDNTEVASGDVTCRAAETSDSLPFEFRDAEGDLIFTNTFTYDGANDTWRWRLDNIQDGASEMFGDVTLRRE
jgi:hypothetical protein